MRPSTLLFATHTLSAGLIALAGCGSVQPIAEAIEVPTSTTSRATAAAGTGPAGLANSDWALTRKAAPYSSANGSAGAGYGGLLRGEPLERPPVGGRVFVVHFGDDGEMVEVTENKYLLPEIYGSTVPVGGDWISTPLPGLTFRSRSYGLQQGDHYAVAARFQVRFVSFLLAHATVYSYGDLATGAADGRFGYELDFTDGLLSFMRTIDDEYSVAGERVTVGSE